MKTIYILNAADAMRSCIAGWRDIFELANRERSMLGLPRLFDVKLVGAVGRSLEQPAPDVFLIPASLAETHAAPDPAVLGAIAAWHRAGATACSACAGSFLIAAAGILDGREATTHWSLAPAFRAAFPAVRLRIEEMLVEHEDVITGGGVTAYFDVALRVVARCGGGALAERCARILLFDPCRPRQTVYEETSSRAGARPHNDESILLAEAWVETRIFGAVSVREWSDGVGLETRTFERRFQAVLGTSPVEYIRKRRLDRARELLGTTARSWEEIASDCGYRDAGAFRRLFVARYGMGPREYRSRFSRR